MSPIAHMDLLNHAVARDSRLSAERMKIPAAQWKLMPPNVQKLYSAVGDGSEYALNVALPTFQPKPSMLFNEDDDPFGGNPNNQNVAERIAASTAVKPVQAPVLPGGDPEAAKAAVKAADASAARKGTGGRKKQQEAKPNGGAAAPTWTPNS